MTFLKYLIIIVLISKTQLSPINITPRVDDDPYRIPSDVLIVNNYNLELTLQDDVFTTNRFGGTLDLQFTIISDTNVIKFHALNITFTDVKLTDQNNNEVNIENTDYEIDPETDFVTLTTTNVLSSGNTYVLHFIYTGILRTDLFRGFYRSSYKTTNGETRYLATTQFQTTHARRAFPCFDEPSYKATFDIKITHPSEYNAIGNTEGTAQVNPSDPTLTTTTFRTTPVMPTYLVAFVVSDFNCTQGVDVEADIPSNVCSRPETANIRDLAVELGPKILWALEDLTGVKYSESGIGKMHQFAIPDFAPGAMENWGLVTYREYYLLWDPKESTNRYRQVVATIIAHEFGHMWFGDLVTTHWWSDTFLNEGFATYFEWVASSQVEPSWELDKQFVIEELHPALVTDASASSNALSHPASNAEEISERFGTISYSKGASVIRMIVNFMGTANFRSGINSYLNANKFRNTKPEDLISALAPYATNLPTGLSLETVTEAWIYNPGYPVLKVVSNGNDIVISQQRYLSSGTPDANAKWYVPVSYTLSSDANRFDGTLAREWLQPSGDIRISGALAENDSWIVLNHHQTGFYRIDYDATIRSRILKALKRPGFDNIPELNRGQLVDDLYKMAQSGAHSFVEFLEFISFLQKDESYFSWYQALQAFSYVLQRTGEARVRTALSEYFAQLLEYYFNSAPFNEPKDDNQIYSLKRALAVSWGCRLGMGSCPKNAAASFTNYRSSGEKPDKNLRSTIYCNGLRYSEDIANDWNFLFAQYLAEEAELEKSSMLSALGCPTDQTAIRTFLSKSIDSTSGLTRDELLSVFSAVYVNNYEGIDTAFAFVTENYQAIASFYGDYSAVNSLISNLAGRFSRTEQTDQLSTFIETSDLPETSKAVARTALTNAQSTIRWIQEFEQQLVTFFDLDNNGSGGGGGDGDGTGSSVSLKAELVLIVTTLLLIVQNLLS